eukprot:1679763-Prymnesium_polylepis.2
MLWINHSAAVAGRRRVHTCMGHDNLKGLAACLARVGVHRVIGRAENGAGLSGWWWLGSVYTVGLWAQVGVGHRSRVRERMRLVRSTRLY